MKQRKGYIYKKPNKTGHVWVARITVVDDLGNRRSFKRNCATRTEAWQALDELRRRVESQGSQPIDAEKITFKEVAEHYGELKLIPPRYVDGVKVAGIRSPAPKIYLKILVDHFGRKRLRSINHAHIEAFKQLRLSTPTKATGRQRTVAAVNRELELLRTIFNFSKRQGWVDRSPFEVGTKLIVKAQERSRDRILMGDEEERLLNACTDRLAHLRPLILAAIDTGMRRGELFKLEWRDVDLEQGIITLRAITTKTERARTIALTDRLQREFEDLWRHSIERQDELVFGVTTNIKNGFTSACKRARITGLRFHDLRHDFISKIIAAGIGPADALKISGHSSLSSLSRYHNTSVENARKAAAALNRLHVEEKSDAVEEMIN